MRRRAPRTWLRASRPAAAVLLTWQVTTVASAQPPESTTAPAMRLGPIGLQPGLQITNLGVDSNVFNEAEDPKSDTTAVAMPSLTFSTRAPRLLVRGTGQLQFVYFQRYTNQRSVNWSADTRADVPLGRVTPFVSWSGQDTQERPSLEVDVRARRHVRVASTGLAVQVAPRLTLLAAMRDVRTRYDDAESLQAAQLRLTLTGTTRDVTAGGKVALTPITKLAVNAQHQQDRFDYTPGRDADSTRVAVGVEFAPLSRFEGRGEIGVRRFDVISPLVPDFSGWVGSADLGYRLGGNKQVRVRATRDVAYSFNITEPYFVLTGADGTYVHRLSERFEALASIGRYALTYREVLVPDGVPGQGPPDLVGRVETGGLGIGVYPRRAVRLGVTAEATRRIGGPRTTYSGLRLFGSITYLP